MTAHKYSLPLTSIKGTASKKPGPIGPGFSVQNNSVFPAYKPKAALILST
jgi:hypothetical protein